MSRAANPNKPKKAQQESEAVVAAKKQKAERERIRRLIITLGDDNKKVISQIRGLAGALEDDIELHGDLMAQTILDCASSLPLKTGIFAAWLTKMAETNSKWVGEVLGRVLEELKGAIRSGRAVVAQLLLRFLVCLGNTGVLGLGKVFKLLQQVLALSEGLKPSKGGDFGVFLACAQLPFLSPAAYKQGKEEVERLIAAAQPYISSRDPRWKPLLHIMTDQELPDRLEALMSSLQALAKSDWASQAVLHVPGFEPAADGKPDMPELALDITAEEMKKGRIRFQVPLVARNLIPLQVEDDGAESPMSEQDRWVLEDYILLTIDSFGRDMDECSKQILRIPVLHSQFEAVAVETILCQMLRLPTPPLLPLFYFRLLESTAEKQNSMKKLIEQAYQQLLERCAHLDEECLDVLAETFAYHLVHNAYQANWSNFTGESVNPRGQRFVRRTLERLQRLSFHQNLIHRLPEAVHVYVPPEPLPASGLPIVSKPQFGRMLGFLRIKDTNEKKVLEFCNWLLKKEEKKGSDAPDSADGAAAPADAAASADGAAADEDKDPDAKRRKLDDGSAKGSDSANAEHAEPPKEPDAKGEVKQGESAKGSDSEAKGSDSANAEHAGPPKEPDAKGEVKQGESAKDGDGAAAAAGPTAQEDFGEAPAEPWPLDDVAELVTFVMLQQGHKTPTHMGKLLDVNQQILVKLRPSAADEAHSFSKRVARCVFDFWKASGQRLEITIDSLLHREVLTPRAVVEVALAQRGPSGCDSMSVWNIINGVARKSLERSQMVRAELALAKKLGKEDTLEKSRKQLDDAIQENAELFTLIFSGLVRNYQDFEDKDAVLRGITLQRITGIGRKYLAFIKPLVDAAEARIPGVAHNPEVAAVFNRLSNLS